MIERTLSKRYARALLAASVRQGIVARIEEEVLDLADTYKKDKRLREFLEHPRIPEATRLDVVRKLLAVRAHPLLAHFVEVLVEKRRTKFLPEIAAQYDALADEYEGVVRVTVTSRSPLARGQQDRLETQLGRRLGKKIDLRPQVDASLLGGVLLRIGDRILDGSVAGRLKAAREALLLRHD
ncbi:MAG: F0F1 ATP synthase subunit delta [Planctomycetes bacterium]|nr:F0F1 ATP synthase subunit delta [Planctomycetota bacterium]